MAGSAAAPRRFRPPLWPTLFAVPAVLVMLGLGGWQLQRLGEKSAAIDERVERTTAAPVEFPFAATAEALPALEFRRSAVAGRFRHDQELYLAARSMRGNPGYQVVTPIEVAEGPHAGAVVLVNRGWVPVERKEPDSRAEGQVAGPVTVEGVIRLPGVQRWMVPDNEPASNVWFWEDLAGMASHLAIADRVAPVFLEAGPADNPGGFPIGGQTRVNLPNDHLQYAITWFALAVALAVIWYLYSRRRRGGPQPGAAGATPGRS
jgi:surfeit locus 1 family protein